MGARHMSCDTGQKPEPALVNSLLYGEIEKSKGTRLKNRKENSALQSIQ